MTRILLFLSLVSASMVAWAQSIPVGMTYYETLLRTAQLTGEDTSIISYCIRPVHHPYATAAKYPFATNNPLLGKDQDFGRWGLLLDSSKGPWAFQDGSLAPLSTPSTALPNFPSAVSYAKGTLQATLLPIEVRTRYNTHHPYGWGDGPMVPNVGLQTFISYGAYVKVGPIEAQLRPERVRAQNLPFEQPPIRQSYIDMPDQFGQDPYVYQGWGQSYIKANLKGIGAGVSTENLWWGPGYYNSLVMTNNAPGFLHLGVHSNKPLQTALGSIEFQAVSGLLKYSGYYPYGTATIQPWPWVTAPIERNTSFDNQRKSFTGLAFSFQPKVLPGLYVGFNRGVMTSADSLTIGSLAEIFRPILKDASGEDGAGRNQIMSAYFRYIFPESHAEIYAEYGREDAAWDLEDLLSDITHTKAYMLGFRKLTPLKKKGTWLMLDYEMTEIAQGLSSLSRAYNYSWYTHSLNGGWTHMGQVMGAGMGPGGSMQMGGLTWMGKDDQQLGFRLERYEHNKETYYYRLPYIQYVGPATSPIWPDISKRWVDLSGFLTYQRRVYGFIVQAQFQVMRTWNFNWQFDFEQPGNAFRQPGQNSTNPQFYLNALYRF